MYCPGCGKTNSTDQRFCRACGLSLESIVKSFQEALPARELEDDIKERTRTVDRWLVGVGGTAAALFLGFVLWMIIYKVIILKGEVLKGSMLLTFILGMATVGILVVYRDTLEKKAKEAQKIKPELPSRHETSQLLGGATLEPVPSVTDRTTELLNVKRQSRVTAPTDTE
jgi:hypothetical protein